jgi:demethylmenaquinone methyltransferase/2-methoxy-6-polyprenyl-1,4-benzoquinol methylase
VTGLDLSADLLNYATESVAQSGMTENITLREGDVNKLPFEDETFNWAWSADCVGYSSRNPLKEIKELNRIVKPGGTIGILIYTSQQLLPGYPGLEARLNCTPAGIAPFTKNMKPQQHYLRLLGWLHKAGLNNPTVQTFVQDFHAPLAEMIKKGLLSLIKMRWEVSRNDLTRDDWDLFQRITQPESPEYILDLPDYYGFFTYSLYKGIRS